MKKQIRVRPVSPDDAEAIAQLTVALGYQAEKETVRSRIGSILSSTENLLIVAVDEAQRPVAWFQAHATEIIESGCRVEIVGLVVAPQFRRFGIGRMLVNEAEDWAKKKRVNSYQVAFKRINTTGVCWVGTDRRAVRLGVNHS